MNQKKVYQEAKFGNCVFVGYDKDGTAKYCSMRAARADSGFRQDVENSDKSYPFSCEGTSDKVIVNEAPIDLMSHASLSKHYGKDWMEDHRISLGCMSDAALARYLEEHPSIKRIIFALDNDYLARNRDGELQNWGQEAAERMCAKYTEMGYKCAVHKPHLKDFNQDLIEVRKGRTPEELDRQREAELKEDFEAHARDEPLSYVLTEPDDEMEICY